MGNEHPKIKVISTEKSWIEGIALQQLETVAKLPGMKKVIGLPDLHAGPVGVALASDTYIYPHLVGNDIGCGMGLWQTDTLTRKAKRDKWINKLSGLESGTKDTTPWFKQYQLNPNLYTESLGTIGGGNHFAELQSIDTIYDEEQFYLQG